MGLFSLVVTLSYRYSEFISATSSFSQWISAGVRISVTAKRKNLSVTLALTKSNQIPFLFNDIPSSKLLKWTWRLHCLIFVQAIFQDGGKITSFGSRQTERGKVHTRSWTGAVFEPWINTLLALSNFLIWHSLRILVRDVLLPLAGVTRNLGFVINYIYVLSFLCGVSVWITSDLRRPINRLLWRDRQKVDAEEYLMGLSIAYLPGGVRNRNRVTADDDASSSHSFFPLLLPSSLCLYPWLGNFH